MYQIFPENHYPLKKIQALIAHIGQRISCRTPISPSALSTAHVGTCINQHLEEHQQSILDKEYAAY